MFKTPPQILAHTAAIEHGNYVTPEYIINKGDTQITLFRRYCPHRMYPMHMPGDVVKNIVCNFHGFEWTESGTPINNNKRLTCGKATAGKSGLIFKDFIEPNTQWVEDLAAETNLVYSHTLTGTSAGSWLWIMEVQADLLHVRVGENAVHPGLSSITHLEDTTMSAGDGWALQTCSTGWWLCVYPYTFVEWSKGCLAMNYAVPKDQQTEFGFTWVSQFYYDPSTTQERRTTFEKYFQDVFLEDIAAIELQKGKYFPLITAHNHLEDHCVHFGKWVNDNLLKDKSI
jgi:phenylpropionate dioxygenase-like ring-hydroxylating dioxygenase large terminal subunit